MLTKNRSFLHTRASLLAFVIVSVAAPGCSVKPPLHDEASAGRPIPAYPMWPEGDHPTLRSVKSAKVPNASGTVVTLHGDQPMNYAVSSANDATWALMLHGIDPRSVEGEVAVGTPELDRIVIRSVWASDRRPAARVEFLGAGPGEHKVTSDGNDLIVTLAGRRDVAPPPRQKVPVPAAEPRTGAATAGKANPPIDEPAGSGQGSTAPSAPKPTVKPSRSAPAGLEVEVAAGRSITLSLDDPVSRVSVANPAVADAVVISPQQLLINGITPGNTSLVLWNKAGEPKNYNLSVPMDIENLALRLREFFPKEEIGVGSSKETLVLYGTVSKPEIGDKAAKIASDYSTKVVNNLTYPLTGRRQILLKVVFAEVNRQALTDLSASLVRVDPNNLRGDHEGLTTTGAPGALGNLINDPPGPDFNFRDAINFYAFNFSDKWAGFITALQTRGLVQILAEPTLVATDGQKASFLAGGEFPIPVVQAGSGVSSVTIEFKKFGINLDFLPEIREDGTIVLKVEPEVSSLDFANAVVLSGFRVPALKVRRASTEVELKDGQSFVIAGLYSSDLQQTKKKIPLLGDIPLLGYLFRSKNLSKNKTELLVFATPVLAEPLKAGEKPELPKFDMSFGLDKKDKKDEKQPDAGARR